MSDSNTQEKILKEQELPHKEGVVEYKFENINITNICPKEIDPNQIYAIKQSANCQVEEKPSFSIIDQKDAGTLFKIYNSQICKEYSKETYRRLHSIKSYQIERLSYEEFCKNWINAPL